MFGIDHRNRKKKANDYENLLLIESYVEMANA